MYRERTRFLLTQSLLGAWLYKYKAEDQEKAHADFLKTLSREPIQPSKAMLAGQQFENMVTAYCEGAPLDESHQWASGIRGVGDIVRGGVFQAAIYKDVTVQGISFLLYGKLDVLRAGTIFDIKHSHSYTVGKYLDSPQHPMYFRLCPEARRFTYVISDGTDVYQETYYPAETQPIEQIIGHFVDYLENTKLATQYIEKWRTK